MSGSHMTPCPICRRPYGNTPHHINAAHPQSKIVHNKECPECRKWDTCIWTHKNIDTNQQYYTCLNCRAQLIDVGKVQFVNVSERRRHLRLLPRVNA